MKIAASITNNTNAKATNKIVLPLVPDKTKEVSSDQKVSHTLYSDPANADTSPKYKVTVCILQGDEDARELIAWRKAVNDVLTGLGINTQAAAVPIVQTMMSGTPQSLFDEGIGEAMMVRREERAAEVEGAARNAVMAQDHMHENNLHYDNIDRALKAVVKGLLPNRVLARAKRYLRRECRKPVGMKVRTYFQHLLRINSNEFPNLPPFAAGQELSPDELLDILLFGTPKSWQKEMERQGFDPMDHTMREVVEFMERIEATEDFDADANTKKSVSTKKGGKDGKKSQGGTGGKQTKYCKLHGEGSHTTDDCNELNKQIKRLKSKGDDNNNGSKKSTNKSWSRKAADEATDKSKKDLAAFIRKEAKKIVKKDLKAYNKKRKNETDDSESEDLDLNAFDLKDFNYEDMEALKITDDGDSVSV